MADTDLQQQTLMVAGTGDTINKLQEVSVQEVQVNESGEIAAADILQQAFQEASEEYEQVAVAYATVEDGVTVLHGTIPEGVLQQVSSGQTIQQVTLTDVVNGTTIADGHEVVEQIPPPEQQEEPAQNNDAEGALVESLTEFVADNVTGQSILIPRGAQVVSEAPIEEEPQEEQQATPPEEESQTSASVRIQPVSTSSFQHISLPPKQTTAPLGSSENPIQIIQQGNTYHSTQVLSSEQLQQIAHVLQQQQVNRAIQNGGSAVVFNPQTNTRIIYRVIYPSEIGGKGSTPSPKTPGRGRGGYSGRSRGRPRGRGWSRRVVEDDEHRSEGPELTREEKEEKKKHRPRTRSGRISKPPSYMVKDYKRIHHLDFDDEPYDDSDGGYSDYQVSDEDERRERKSHSSGHGGRPRNYKCGTCGKQYIGRASLARHLRLYPDHGNASDAEEMSTHDENSNSSMSGHAQNSPAANPGAQAGMTRARYSDMAAIRRKSRLRESIKVCSDEELMEIVMPRLAESVSLWEFLLMKSEKGDPPRPQVPDMLLNLEELLGEIQKLGRECLRSAEVNQDGEPAETLPPGGQYVKIEDEAVAHALGLATGLYAVLEENAPGQPQVRHRKRTRSSDGEKELAEVLAVGDVQAVNEVLGDSSIVEFVTPEEMVAALHGEPLPPNKRLRLDDTDGLVVLPAGAVSIDTSKSDGGNAIMEAALNSDSLSENMLENLEFTGLQAAAEEGAGEAAAAAAAAAQTEAAPAAAEADAQQVEQLSQEQAQQQLQQTAETLRFVAVNPGQKIQILPGQSLLNRNFVRVVTSSEGPPSPTVQQAQPEDAVAEEPASAQEPAAAEEALTVVMQENEEEPQIPAEQVPAEVEAGAAEAEMIVAEAPTSEPQECTSDGVSSDAARMETMVQVVESHGDDDSEQELAQVVCAAEDAAPEGSAVVRQYLLPDGQIISAYEDGEGGLVQFTGGTEAEAEVEAEAEEETTTALGNVVIMQNPDGTTTLQVPSDGSIPIETVQALLAMDHSAMVVQASQDDALVAEGV
ncbi:uncharacterized protein LOC135401516 isoform X2 [Ornithodoros turicata]|uniref:uncharacterized protein LOC135401516 isoform X2 n=1 Tax=Ornithodoros turicata TaxID=34597 RepID=UPI00313A225E